MAKDTYSYSQNRNVVSNLLLMKCIFKEAQRYGKKRSKSFESWPMDKFYQELGISQMTFTNIVKGNDFYITERFKDGIMNMLGIKDEEFASYFGRGSEETFEFPSDQKRKWEAFMNRDRYELKTDEEGSRMIFDLRYNIDISAQEMIQQIVKSFWDQTLFYNDASMVYRICYFARYKKPFNFSEYWPELISSLAKMKFADWKALDEENTAATESYIEILKKELDMAEAVHKFNSYQKKEKK